MGKLTTHVLDLHAGTPAASVRIELHALDAAVPELLVSTETNGDGRCSSPLLEGDTMKAERYLDRTGQRRTFDQEVMIFDGNIGSLDAHNALLSTYQQRFAALTGAARVSADPSLVIADVSHRWGLSPFHYVADYYRARNVPMPTPPFIDVAVICFGIAAPAENYHVPLLVSPWSYSTYRGS